MACATFLVPLFVTLLACTEVRSKEFKVYWNVPTELCRKYNVNFDFVATEYGITQNTNDTFKGDKITILYNPGAFPKVYNYTHNYSLQVQDTGSVYLENGGIPQDAVVSLHFNTLNKHLDRDIPDPNYNGIAIIDMEQWGGTWAQNFNNMEINKILSRYRVQNKYPTWTPDQVEKLAKEEYEKAAIRLLYTTLVFAKAVRPYAKWGYYQYPQCFNKPGVNYCSTSTQKDNDLMLLLWKRSEALYPSLYLSLQGTIDERAEQIRGEVREATRAIALAKTKGLNLPYIWYKYHGRNENILDEDLESLIRVPKEEGADGVILWGSSGDVNSADKCLKFKDYVINSLGPIIRNYTSEPELI